MLTGAAEMKRKIRAVNMGTRAEKALFIEANIEMTEMKARTPVDITPNAPHPGQLRASGTVHPAFREGDNIVVIVSFGTDYAIYVHENPDAYHPVGEYKYAESVLNESRPHMPARLALRMAVH